MSYPRTDYIDAQPDAFQVRYYKGISQSLTRALARTTARWLKAAARVKELEAEVES